MLALHDILRAGSVKRFHIVNTTRVQTLAEHQYGVAVIASEIAHRMGFDASIAATVMSVAILHDAGEARTGDLPTPTKKRLRSMFGGDFDAALAEFDHPSAVVLPAQVKSILKCADYLESMVFLMEHKVGRHADAVMDDIMGDAFDFFERSGEAGRVSHQIWSDIRNAVYEI